MPKLKNILPNRPFITATVKCLFFGLMLLSIVGLQSKKHPFYLSVVDITNGVGSNKELVLNVSVKMFTNDIEDALKKTTTKSIDLLNPKNKVEMETELTNYIKKRLSISVNTKTVNLDFIGYEREEDAVWTYFEIKKITKPKNIKVDAKLLFDFLPQQSNIVHAEINGVKKSSKVNNPDSKVEFQF